MAERYYRWGWLYFALPILLAFQLFQAGCSTESDSASLTVVAPNEREGAMVLIDDVEVGELEEYPLYARLLMELLQPPDFFPKDDVALSVLIDGLSAGEHVLLVKDSETTICSFAFSVPTNGNLLISISENGCSQL